MLIFDAIWTIFGISFLVSLFYVLVFAFTSLADSGEDESKKITKILFCSKISKVFHIIVLISIISFSSYITFANVYIELIKEINSLKVSYNYGLDNLLYLSNTINEKAVVKTEHDKLIIDVANLSQSTKASSVYVSYVNNVNRYNHKLAEEQSKRFDSIVCKMKYGWLVPIPEELRYILIRDRD
jgi:hypothetical protein